MKEIPNGTIIKTNAKGRPFVHHYGIVVNYNGADVVLHNPHGGKPVIDPIDDFFANRTLIETYGIALDGNTDTLISKHAWVQNRLYSVWNWNCEDYVNYMGDENKFYGGKLAIIIAVELTLSILFIIVYLLLIKKK